MKLDLEGFVRGERGGEALVEPKTKLLFIFGILRSLLRPGGEIHGEAENCREDEEALGRNWRAESQFGPPGR